MIFSSSASGPQKTPATCKTTTCAAGLSDIDDSTLSLMKTGFTACGSLAEPKKSRADFAAAMNYLTFITIASMCGQPASIVKVTRPALNTCDGATARYVAFMTQECPTSGPDPSVYPATCGNDACKAAISSIDDNTLSLMKTGFTTCTPGPHSYASTASEFNYEFLIQTATHCGQPASTVKVTPPAGASLACGCCFINSFENCKSESSVAAVGRFLSLPAGAPIHATFFINCPEIEC
jgi:hypothetical protein